MGLKMNHYLKILLFLFVICFSIKVCNAQTEKDTIYFDGNFSVCEKEVAEYYRVCTLNKEVKIFYKDPVEDYYMDGSILMTGKYDSNGMKQGEFVFYNTNGTPKKKINFVNNEPHGLWSYYDNNGKMYAQFDCTTKNDFTPLLIIDQAGDTLLKNGNGKFKFYAHKDLPEIFEPAKNYFVSGEVQNGKKEGALTYSSSEENKNLMGSEVYKNGVLKRVTQNSYTQNGGHLNPLGYLSLQEEQLNRIESFYHSNLVFGFEAEGEQKLINWLLNKEPPDIKSNATSFDNNSIDFYKIIAVVLRGSLSVLPSGISYINDQPNIHFYPKLYSNYAAEVYVESYNPVKNNPVRNISSDVELEIDTNGYVSNSVFRGNLTKKEINKMNYYFSTLYNLYPYDTGKGKQTSTIKLRIYSEIDTTLDHVMFTKINGKDTLNEKKLTFVEYKCFVINLAYESDSAFANRKNSLSIVEKEAEFPGGQQAWAKYLTRNLNGQIPSNKGAPPGIYRVVVSFFVDKDGKVTSVSADNDPGYGMAQEAIRVIKAGPNWVPANQDGKLVSSRKSQPIVFQVSKD